MSALVTSDWHGDAVTDGFNRHADVSSAADQIVDDAVARKVDAFLHLGDVSDPDNVRCHRAVQLAHRCAVRCDAAGIPSVWLVGNHDVVEDGSASHTLSSLGEIGRRVTVIAEPTAGFLAALGGAYVVALPFVSRTRSYDAAAFVREVAPASKGRPVVVLSHLTVPGIQKGSESTSMTRGRDVVLPLAAIAECFGDRALVLQGHYHRRQSWRSPEGVMVHVPGAPERLRHDEEDHDPGYLVASWQA